MLTCYKSPEVKVQNNNGNWHPADNFYKSKSSQIKYGFNDI